MKKTTIFSAPLTSPLILLAGGDYWHAGFPGLDKQDRGRDDGGLAHDYFDKNRPDGFVIHHGLLVQALKPLPQRAMIRLTTPADEKRPDKFLMGLLAKAGAPTKISNISQGIYYQSSLAVKKSGIIAMRLSETEAMVYDAHAHANAKSSDKKLPSPFMQPAGAGWQLVRVSGNKKLKRFLASFIAMPEKTAKPNDGHNFYCLSILNVSVYLFHDGDEALFFIPRSVASSMLCHLATMAAATTDNLTRVTIDY